MNVAARGPAGALGRGPAGSRRRAARPFEYGRRASMASLRIGEPPRSRARGPQGPFVQVLNCPPKRVRSRTRLPALHLPGPRPQVPRRLKTLRLPESPRLEGRRSPPCREVGGDQFQLVPRHGRQSGGWPVPHLRRGPDQVGRRVVGDLRPSGGRSRPVRRWQVALLSPESEPPMARQSRPGT